LGNKNEARRSYDKAVTWTKTNHVNDELRRFRAEASALLGEAGLPAAGNGDRHGREGRLSPAQKQYAVAVRSSPADSAAAMRLAFLRLELEDRGGYQTICRDMLERFADTDDPHTARRTAHACLISASPVGQLEKLQRLADLAVAVSERGA